MPVGIRKPSSAAVVSLCVLVGALVFSATPAVAAEHWGALGVFGSTGAGTGQMEDPAGVAVNDATTGASAGDVYVVDRANNRIDEFGADGTFIRAWGWGVADGLPMFETCTLVCQAGSAGSGAGQLDGPEGIAVDNSGSASDPSKEDVYVTNTADKVIDKFTATGAYIGQITGTCPSAGTCSAVNIVPFEELYGVAVDPDGGVWMESGAPGYGHPAIDSFNNEQPNVFIASRTSQVEGGARDGLAVDSEDNLYVVVREGRIVDKLNSAGEAIGEKLGGVEGVSGVAVDPASNDVYIDSGANVVVVSPAESLLETFGAGPLDNAGGVAVNPVVGASGYAYLAEPASNDLLIFEHSTTPPSSPPAPATEKASEITAATWTLHGDLNPQAAPGGVGYYFSYHAGAGSSCTELGSETTPLDNGASNLTGTKAVDVSATVALAPHEEYVFCLVADRYGATPGNAVQLTTGAAPPTVGSENVSGVDASEAHLEALVNPSNEATECRFEYGTASVSEHVVECEQGDALAGGEQGVGVTVTGLKQNMTYQYHVVVENAQSKSEHKPVEGAIEHFTTAIHPETPQELKAESVTATTATLRGVVNPHAPGDPGSYEFLYRPSPLGCEGGEPAGGSAPGHEEEDVKAELTGLTPNTTYAFCLAARNEAGEESALSTPASFTTPPLAPAIASESSTVVGATEARLEAEISPGNSETVYHFEYGPAAGSYEVSVPAAGTHIPASLIPHSVSAVATGLQPGTTYHYRVVASNALPGEVDGSDQTFTTPTAQGTGSPSSCPNEQRRAEQPYGLTLPDCRAYEMVSPVETNGQDATDSFVASRPRASTSGEAVTYASKGNFADPTGSSFVVQFLSRRGPEGWSTQEITPLHDPSGAATTGSYEETVFTPELTGGIASTSAQLTSEAPAPDAGGQSLGESQLYVADFASHSYQYVGLENQEANPAGASIDLSHVVFAGEKEKEEGAEESVSEWVDGKVTAVSVTNNGESTGPSSVGSQREFRIDTKAHSVWHAVSGNGSRVYFTSPGWAFSPALGSSPPGVLYLRENAEQPQSPMSGGTCIDPSDACTVDVSASQRKVADPHGPQTAHFWGASADGSKVFFTSKAELAEDADTGFADNAANLYEYDLDRAEGERLKDLTVDETDTEGAAVLGVVQISEDGSYVYFVADGDLATGATSGEPNLYVSHEGGVPKFIATLAPSDSQDWLVVGAYDAAEAEDESGPALNTAAVTPSGTRLAFMSHRELTGYDTDDVSEIFLYDAGSGGLVCASCNPSGARPVGTPNLLTARSSMAQYRPRDLLEDGTLFFDSSDALVPHASDGRQNVYEYESGHVYPISDVAGGSESFFLDASANGENVFFGTADQLLLQDTSNNVVVYDARVGGGFPVIVAPPVCTNADSCKPPVAPQPSVFSAAGTATFNGVGNLSSQPPPKETVTKKTAKCKQGFVKNKSRKCVKKHRTRKRVKKSAHANRRAGR